MFLSLVAKLGLGLGYPGTYAIIIIIGFLCFSERIYGTTLYLLLFTMVYNYFLKSIWQEPLPPPMEGWAFPSGHTHSAVIFWGWLACQYRHFSFSAIVVFILCLVGYGLVHDGYHYPKDVVGAVGFGVLSLVLYYGLNSIRYFQKQPYAVGWVLIPLATLFALLLPKGHVLPHIWQALGGLMGFSLGWTLLRQRSEIILSSAKEKLAMAIIAFAGVALIIGIFMMIPLSKEINLFCRMFVVTLWVSTLKLIAHPVLRRFHAVAQA